MPDFTVIRLGEDSSGRDLFMTRYMKAWWDDVCVRLGFTPTVVQGAFMSRVAGGGAKASDGYHDLGGCLDVRVWDLKPEQQHQLVREVRRSGAGAWLRDKKHGGFDPHVHLVLGSDSPLHAKAAAQWQAYQDGLDGLAGRGEDYHWRPSPLVLVPPPLGTASTLASPPKVKPPVDGTPSKPTEPTDTKPTDVTKPSKPKNPHAPTPPKQRDVTAPVAVVEPPVTPVVTPAPAGQHRTAVLATINIDFTDGPAREAFNLVAALPGVDVAFLQEAKDLNARKVLNDLFGVAQNRSSGARAGSVVAWDKGRGVAGTTGQTLGTVSTAGHELLPRWLTWVDLTLDGLLTFRAVAAHRPPLRFKDLWPGFDAQLRGLVEESELPVVVGIDSNTHDGPGFAANVGLEWVGEGIDGFAHDPRIVVGDVRRLKPTHSDHRPVVVTLDVDASVAALGLAVH